jgi:hypothetical protein
MIIDEKNLLASCSSRKKLAELKPLKLQTQRVTIKEAEIKPLKISLWHPKVKRNNISHQQVRE